MRDIVVTVLIVGAIPWILARPYVGILVWSWVSYMSPHRLASGFAYDMPFAQIVAVATIVGLLLSKEPKRIPVNALTVIWGLFILWMMVTTVFAISADDANEQLMKVLKVQLMTFLTLMLVNSRQRVHLLVWVIALSIGFYSVKGGWFTLITGGGERVFGPEGGFTGENNSFALATLMVIPLMLYLFSHTANRWVRVGLLAAAILSVVSVLGSHSRGAIIAGVVGCTFFLLTTKRKLLALLLFAILIPSVAFFMPDAWHQRIGTITTESEADIDDIVLMRTRSGEGMLSAPIESRDRLGYWPTDFSALGRVNAWNYAINIANDRVTGAGFESWSAETFRAYAPIVEEVQAAHSIFFGVLADHGWTGLLMFLAIIAMTLRMASVVISRAKPYTDLAWAADLARMIQISLITYCVGGAFLSLAYYDLPWHLIAVVIVCKLVTDRQLQSAPANVLQQGADARSRLSGGVTPKDTRAVRPGGEAS